MKISISILCVLLSFAIHVASKSENAKNAKKMDNKRQNVFNKNMPDKMNHVPRTGKKRGFGFLWKGKGKSTVTRINKSLGGGERVTLPPSSVVPLISITVTSSPPSCRYREGLVSAPPSTLASLIHPSVQSIRDSWPTTGPPNGDDRIVPVQSIRDSWPTPGPPNGDDRIVPVQSTLASLIHPSVQSVRDSWPTPGPPNGDDRIVATVQMATAVTAITDKVQMARRKRPMVWNKLCTSGSAAGSGRSTSRKYIMVADREGVRISSEFFAIRNKSTTPKSWMEKPVRHGGGHRQSTGSHRNY